MAKKIKFPLILKNDAQVRTLEELQENFEFDRIYDYFVSGKLVTWLNDRYYEGESEQIGCLTGEEDSNSIAFSMFTVSKTKALPSSETARTTSDANG